LTGGVAPKFESSSGRQASPPEGEALPEGKTVSQQRSPKFEEMTIP
jgi:hypothetical protein